LYLEVTMRVLGP